MLSRRTTNRIHKTFTAFMAIWLSGVVFVGWCGAMNFGSSDRVSCPLAKVSNHCDKQAGKTGSHTVVKLSENRYFDCCGFIPLVFDKARKVDSRQAETGPAAETLNVRFEIPPYTGVGETTRPRYKPPPKYRKLFITNRVLRI